MAAEWAQPQWDRQDMDRDNQARGTINSMNNTGRWGMGNIEMGVDGSPSNMMHGTPAGSQLLSAFSDSLARSRGICKIVTTCFWRQPDLLAGSRRLWDQRL
ncbi:hypothetical protein PABG_12010 [Paracoccidioides brasiliensis Pb03]|nr:hypothetical protein PABG_12010 [Paracoccidioides brasiliensis Pb03]